MLSLEASNYQLITYTCYYSSMQISVQVFTLLIFTINNTAIFLSNNLVTNLSVAVNNLMEL